MLNVVLKKSGQTVNDVSKFFLSDDEMKFEGIDVSPAELNFIRKEFDKKTYLVAINRFSHWLFVVRTDPSKKPVESLEALRKAGNEVCRYVNGQSLDTIEFVDGLHRKEEALSLLEGFILGNYQFVKYHKPDKDQHNGIKDIRVVSPVLAQTDLDGLGVLAEAVFITRDLVNEPPSFLTSLVLSAEISRLGKEAGFSVEVLDKSKIQALQMGGILAVNKGSSEPPTFSVLEWKPENALNTKPIVLVGKGIVYDTGGYSLKPTPDSMDYMKSDMAGAATVASVMYAIARNKVPVHLVGLVPSTDNRIGPDAYSPGDVITMSDGTTVEILNTDAEGRLILADALHYAKKYSPALVISIATLTGAAQRAIGSLGMVAMGNAPADTMRRLEVSGDKVYERVALFPFWDEYTEQLKSNIADLKNVGDGSGGAITAGKFLEHFTGYPFIHLDIAGVAFFKKPNGYQPAGGTGFGVRVLYQFINDYIAAK